MKVNSHPVRTPVFTGVWATVLPVHQHNPNIAVGQVLAINGQLHCTEPDRRLVEGVVDAVVEHLKQQGELREDYE